MKRVAFIFPGQGSQEVGMGKGMYENYESARRSFEQADELLDTTLTTLMFEGPVEELTNTENAQPALLLTSAVINQALNDEGIYPVVTAGHSLGEYSALVASGAISLEEALPLVQTRGRLMEKAYPKGQGAMAAVLGLSRDEIEKVIHSVNLLDEVVDIANLNCPGQIVISGTKNGIETISESLKEAGAKRVILLNVSGPFHSRLMKAAAEQFAEALEQVNLVDANIPVYANVTANQVKSYDEIKDLLIQQLYSPVRFEETIEHLLQDELDAIVEVGNGKVLTGLVKKVNRRTKTFTIQDPESLQLFIDWYKEES
ncbi:ACP S-malonyltransferase [Aquibacillus koreensis]|uniref:Malonyl CoA-acyl carrier protein transacylase n=1 Tax=Aquibacillus koreensis TaxID=279446 RepID=A0A9X3WND2_9BACI|nr:ACP S-malonyltransferase [Aquibacillus koreensis]MCT2538003.1 ACP S-malonyltransferase [Aquibacillus koreensis]MDC3420526.1 ACP S-malonyltransferase [Aquibacillus koreensis]